MKFASEETQTLFHQLETELQEELVELDHALMMLGYVVWIESADLASSMSLLDSINVVIRITD